MTGAQLLHLAYAAANSCAKRTGSGLDSRKDDLAQYLCLTILRRAPSYNPARNTGFDPARNPSSTPFRSWAWYIMGPRLHRLE